MTGEKVNFEQAAEHRDDAESGSSKYERSTIEFPYGDLDDAVEVAKAVWGYGLECDTDQLAATLGQSAKSGAFRLKTAAARVFGLTENERGHLKLTDLGREIVSADTMRRARADAFLQVPLYKAIYDQFRGSTLPPAPAMERFMQNLGVAKKQAAKARQAFERSAEQAGYYETGKDRLVRPGNLGDQPPPPEEPEGKRKNGGSGGGGGDDLHPFIQGLLNELPEPKSKWSAEKRAEWLQAAEHLFRLLYTGGDDGSVSVTFTGRENGRGRDSGADETR